LHKFERLRIKNCGAFPNKLQHIKKTQMDRIIISLILIVLFTNLTCLSQNDCEKLKNKEISLSFIKENKEEFLKDIEVLMNCYYDSIDMQILKGSSGENLEFILSILNLTDLKNESEVHSTYNVFIKQWNEMKKTKEYKLARQVVIAKNEIINRKANIVNWENDFLLLKKMNFTKNDISRIEIIVKENENNDWTYFDVFQELTVYYQTKSTTECPFPSYYDWLHLPHKLDGYFELAEGMECSRISNKPLLLYFTGHGSVASREFEAFVMSDSEILKLIKQKYIITCLYVDDKGKALPQYHIYSEQTNDTIRQIGKINQYYQKQLSSNNDLPVLYIIDSEGNQLSDSYYFNESIDLFREFLTKGIEFYYEE